MLKIEDLQHLKFVGYAIGSNLPLFQLDHALPQEKTELDLIKQFYPDNPDQAKEYFNYKKV